MSKRFGADVEVEFLQDDMVGFVREPFNQEFDLYGKKLFTDKVRWGEVWLCDQSKRGTKYAGYIQNGALYLDQSAAELNAWVKTRQPRKPSKLRPGRYLVWLDAWLRMGDVIYTSDGPFTTLTEDMEESTWVAPPPPKREYWQEIVVTRPKSGKDKVCRIRLKSRRFHWLYRLSRVLDALNTTLAEHEKQIAPVGMLRTWADFVYQMTEVIKDSGPTLKFLPNSEQFHHYRVMRDMAVNVMIRCDNFITFGATEATPVVPALRKHINNVAMLLWHMIHLQEFADEMDLFSPAFAEEHRLLLSQLQGIFNRVPLVPLAIEPDGRVTSYTKRFGEEFAVNFTFPYLNQKIGFPLFKQAKPVSTIKFLNSVRRYSISMLNNASIFFVRENVTYSNLRKLLGSGILDIRELELQKLSKSKNLVQIWDRLMQKYAEAGDAWNQHFGRAVVIKYRHEKEVAAVEQKLAAIRNDIHTLLKELEDDVQLRDQKALSLLEDRYPPLVHLVQCIDAFIKFLYIFDAVNEFRKKGDFERGARLGLAVADTLGSALKSLAAQKFIKNRWPSLVGKYASPATIARGLNFASDLGGTLLYQHKVMSDAYKEELLDKYYPEDSTRIYAWNMVQWAGRWMVTIGSGGDFATGPAQMWMKANPAKVPGFVNKAGPAAPVLTALQGLGYLAQFAAEIFEKQVREAADVRNYFRAAHDQLWQLSINLRNELDGDGLTWTFYTVAEKLAMEASIRAFDWAPMDRLLVETRLKPYLAQETMEAESSAKGVTVSR